MCPRKARPPLGRGVRILGCQSIFSPVRAPRPRRRHPQPPIPRPSDPQGSPNPPRPEDPGLPAQQPQNTNNLIFADVDIVIPPNYDIEPDTLLDDEDWISLSSFINTE